MLFDAIRFTCATACTTGAHGIGEAFRIIQRGDAEVMICGGSEAAVTPLAVARFFAVRALSTPNPYPRGTPRPRGLSCGGCFVGAGAGVPLLSERGPAFLPV